MQARKYQPVMEALQPGISRRLEDMQGSISNMSIANGSLPNTNLTAVFDGIDSMMQQVKTIFKCISHEYFVGFKDEDSMVKRAINTSQLPVIASMCFIIHNFLTEVV